MAEGARLESVYTLIAYRGFESLRLRHFNVAIENQYVDKVLNLGVLIRKSIHKQSNETK